MKTAKLPENEIQRLQLLKHLNILDTAPEDVFENFTCIAASLCDTPISLITLIDSDRQWFKSRIGLDLQQTSRDVSFCAHAIADPPGMLIVPDALQDDRFADNPLVLSDPSIRFYAGLPLVIEGKAIGTLCVIDRKPRELTEEQIAGLKALHSDLLIQLELRKTLADFSSRIQMQENINQEFLKSVSEMEEKVKAGALELSLVNKRLREELAERKRIEQELVISRQKALESDYLKSEFLGQMSHEVRSPLNIILTNLSYIRSEIEVGLTDELLHSFSAIENGSRRLIRTMDLILNLSELKKDMYCPDFNEYQLRTDIIEPVLLKYELKAKKNGIRLLIDDTSGERKVKIDSYSVSQIFENLIDNAVKFTKEGFVKIILHNDGQLRAEISDTGIGISPEFIPHLFDPFAQEDQGYTRNYDGSGLGMTLVKKYCEINGIDIQVKSTKGEGTKVILTFP